MATKNLRLPGTYALGAQFRDVGIDKSTKTLSRTILGQVPVATVDGPKKIDEFGCNESDVDNPIRTDEAHPPYFVEEFRGQRSLKLDLLHNYDTFVRKDHHALDLGEKVLWLEHKLKTQPGVPLKQVQLDAKYSPLVRLDALFSRSSGCACLAGRLGGGLNTRGNTVVHILL